MRNSTQPKCQQQLTDVLAFKTDTSWETECWVLFLKSSQRPGFFKHIFGQIRVRWEYNSMSSRIRWSFLWNSLVKVWYTTINISVSPHLSYTTLLFAWKLRCWGWAENNQNKRFVFSITAHSKLISTLAAMQFDSQRYLLVPPVHVVSGSIVFFQV